MRIVVLKQVAYFGPVTKIVEFFEGVGISYDVNNVNVADFIRSYDTDTVLSR